MYATTPSLDIFNDVLPGDPWQPEPAARYNAVNELLRQENYTEPGVSPRGAGIFSCVNVINTSDRPIFENKPVQIETEFAGENDRINKSDPYVCGRPLEKEHSFWGLSLERIDPGKAGVVQIAGAAYIRLVRGQRFVYDSYKKDQLLCRNDFVLAGMDGSFHILNRGQARLLWHDPVQESAIVLLNSPSSSYDGMFAVIDNGDRTLTVKGGCSDLKRSLYTQEASVLEECQVPIFTMSWSTWVCLTAVRNSEGGWELGVENSSYRSGYNLYIPGEKMVWPLASYISADVSGYVNGLVQLHYGAVNFKERYFVE